MAALLMAPAAQAGHVRPVQVRISWLERRVGVRTADCWRHETARDIWSCKALVWAKQSLRRAHAEQRRLEWRKPPEPYYSLARCEQRDDRSLYGVRWNAYSASYEGGYGFTHETWRQFRYPWMPEHANQATPRQQTLVAMRLHRRFGGYSPWPACHIRLGLE